jgi:hypothetical protein
MPGSIGFDSESKSVGALFVQYSESRRIAVPPFQRPYSWEIEHVSQFWEDVKQFREARRRKKGDGAQEYFIGPIVLHPEGQNLTLLDGQQRLATATILFSVLREAAKSLAIKSADEEAEDIQRNLITKGGSSTFCLMMGETDKEFFRRTVQEEDLENCKAKSRSNKLLAKAQKYLQGQVEEELQAVKTKPQKLKRIQEIKRTVATELKSVVISVATENEAYHIFETLNDRGLRLTVSDLVLNFLMSESRPLDRGTVRDRWNDLIETLGQEDITRFFRYMWVSQYGDVKAQSLFLEIKRRVKSDRISPKVFAKTCAEYAEAFVKLKNAVRLSPCPFANIGLCRNLDAIIHGFGAVNAVPVLLAGERNLRARSFARIVEMTCRIVVRYKVLGNQNPYKLESTFYLIAKLIHDKKEKGENDSKVVTAVKEEFAKLDLPDISILELASELEVNGSEAKYLLRGIANHGFSKNAELGVTDATVEHIFPQSAELREWPNKAKLQGYEWYLGNLTLLGGKPNDRAANKSFQYKCSKVYPSSDIAMTSEIPSLYARWDLPEIESRAKELVSKAVNVWRKI